MGGSRGTGTAAYTGRSTRTCAEGGFSHEGITAECRSCRGTDRKRPSLEADLGRSARFLLGEGGCIEGPAILQSTASKV